MADSQIERLMRVAKDIDNKKISSEDLAAMLAGMVDGVIHNLFAPMTKAIEHDPFGPGDLVSRVLMPDDKWIKITIEVES